MQEEQENNKKFYTELFKTVFSDALKTLVTTTIVVAVPILVTRMLERSNK